MPIGYITENNGESRYTVAVPRRTTLLAELIAARGREIEGIDTALGELTKHEQTRRATYDAAMGALNQALIDYQTCRNAFVPSACESAREAEIQAAYSAARDACTDTHRDCLLACDIGDRECQDACDETRDACEEAAETARDRTLEAVERLCQDDLIQHLAACQAQWAPIIAGLQANATEALAPLQDVMIAITWEKAKRLAAARRLTELEGIESGADMRVTWSAQYRDDLPAGPVPENPTGEEENAVQLAMIGDSPHISGLSTHSYGKCLHDARALPAGTLFIDSALQPGVETWRPTWRRGVVLGKGEESGTLKVRIEPLILTGTLGTRVSRKEINCTPPGRFFDEDGELDARVGAARQDYADALEALDEIRATIQACKDAYTLLACQTDAWALCEQSRDASRLDCLDARAQCLLAGGSVEYCDERYAECSDQVDAIYSACIDEATAECGDLKAAHDAQCDRDNAGALAQAESAVSSTLRALMIQIGNFEGPAEDVELELPVAHCVASTYEDGDTVLIDFPDRTASAELDWRTATAEQIRAVAMKTWKSGRVIGWAWDTRKCGKAILYGVFLSSSGYGARCYVSPVGASNGIPTWREMIALYDAAIANELTISAGYADPGEELTWVDLDHQYVDSGGEIFYVRSGCESSIINTSPSLYISNAREYFEAPYYDEQVYVCNATRAAARSAADVVYTAALASILSDEVACKNAVPMFSLEWWACDSAADALRADALDAKTAAYDAADAAHESCVAVAQRPLPSLDDQPLEFVSALSEGTAYYGIQCSATGYLDCEQTQRTPGKPVQAYRIIGEDVSLDIQIRYIGLTADLIPACPQVTEITTSALVHPELSNACGTPVTGPPLVIPDPAP